MMGKNEEVCDAHTEGDECPYCIIDNLRDEAARMQLVAGRYQFMWEAAQRALNRIDDYFEYVYKTRTPEQLQEMVRHHLEIYTEAVSKPKAQIGK